MSIEHHYLGTAKVTLVVKNLNTGSEVNFSYKELANPKNNEPRYQLIRNMGQGLEKSECEQAEKYVQNLPQSEKLEHEYSLIMEKGLKLEYLVLSERAHGASKEDLVNLYRKALMIKVQPETTAENKKDTLVYAIADQQGMIVENINFFDTYEHAQAEMDKDDDLIILEMKESHFEAQCIISEMSKWLHDNGYSTKAAIQLFNHEIYSESKDFVANELSQVNISQDIAQKYFKYLFSVIYDIKEINTLVDGMDGMPSIQEESEFNYQTPLTYKEFALEQVNDILFSVFDKKVDIKGLLKKNDLVKQHSI
jgi:hypothetical protein